MNKQKLSGQPLTLELDFSQDISKLIDVVNEHYESLENQYIAIRKELRNEINEDLQEFANSFNHIRADLAKNLKKEITDEMLSAKENFIKNIEDRISIAISQSINKLPDVSPRFCMKSHVRINSYPKATTPLSQPHHRSSGNWKAI